MNFQPHRSLYGAALFILLAAFLSACGGETDDGRPTLEPLAEAGQRIFMQRCTSCHSTQPDTIVVGPSLSGVASRAGSRVEGLEAPQYIRQSILTPDAYVVDGFPNLMPTNFSKLFSDEQVDKIVAYLMTLE